jgi:hypothetical protein
MKPHDVLIREVGHLAKRLGDGQDLGVIPWAAPVLFFGDLFNSSTATLGLNPSNREFLGSNGEMLSESERRLETQSSLGLRSWADTTDKACAAVLGSCSNYFRGRPYDAWFKRMEPILQGVGASYYFSSSAYLRPACHLDLVPFATFQKWVALPTRHRRRLLELGSQSLIEVLINSPVEVLILNGRTVAEYFQSLSNQLLSVTKMPRWNLRRSDGCVDGFAFFLRTTTLANRPLGRTLTVIGFNHNIQSSYGVSNRVVSEIREWAAKVTERTSVHA